MVFFVLFSSLVTLGHQASEREFWEALLRLRGKDALDFLHHPRLPMSPAISKGAAARNYDVPSFQETGPSSSHQASHIQQYSHTFEDGHTPLTQLRPSSVISKPFLGLRGPLEPAEEEIHGLSAQASLPSTSLGLDHVSSLHHENGPTPLGAYHPVLAGEPAPHHPSVFNQVGVGVPAPLSTDEKVSLLHEAARILDAKPGWRETRLNPFTGRFLTPQLAAEAYAYPRRKLWILSDSLVLVLQSVGSETRYSATHGGMVSRAAPKFRIFLWKRTNLPEEGSYIYQLVGMIETNKYNHSVVKHLPAYSGIRGSKHYLVGPDSLFDMSILVKSNNN